MAQTVHLWVTGETQGEIQGDSTITSMDREGTIEAFRFEHNVHMPYEQSSGMASSHRVHSPIIITKAYDRSSPLLYAALCNNETLEVTIRFYRPNPEGDGTTQQFFTIELQNARIVSISSVSPDVQNSGTSGLPASENVSFVYRQITWTYEDGGITCQDEWGSGSE